MDIIVASFMIKSFIASGILYLYYQLALRNKKFHLYNRFYLLLSVFISIIVPFIDFGWLYIEASPLQYSTANNTSQTETDKASLLNTSTVLIIIMWLLSLLLLISLIIKIRWIYNIRSTSKVTKLENYKFIETTVKEAPFSFLNNLFWKQGLSVKDANGEKIIKHELAHILQRHTYDKLFTQIVCCLLWMNPFYWLIQKELNTIHEFLADAATVEDGDTAAFATMLLYSHDQGSYLSPAHPFFNSSIKRRLIMISTSNKTPYSFLRRVLALPIALFVLVIASVNIKAQTVTTTETKQESSKQPITVSGYKTVQKKQPNSKSGLQPTEQPVVTVSGYKKKQQKQSGTSAKPAAKQPVVVSGYKKSQQKQSTTAAEPQVAEEPVVVVGYKTSQKKQPTTATEPQASEEPVVVVGYKTTSKKQIAEEPVTVKGQKSTRKSKSSAKTGQKSSE